LPALADFDHIGDFNEMILHPLAAIETGRAGGLDDGLKVTVVGLAKHFREVSAGQNSLPAGLIRRIASKGVISLLMALQILRMFLAAMPFCSAMGMAYGFGWMLHGERLRSLCAP